MYLHHYVHSGNQMNDLCCTPLALAAELHTGLDFKTPNISQVQVRKFLKVKPLSS